MATITARKITESGIAESLSDATQGGDSFTNSGLEFVKISNNHASLSYDVTFTPPSSGVINSPRYGKVTKSAVEITVAAGAEAYAGPFKQEIWNDGNNNVSMTYKKTSDDAAIAAAAGTHLLDVEVLYLDFK